MAQQPEPELRSEVPRSRSHPPAATARSAQPRAGIPAPVIPARGLLHSTRRSDGAESVRNTLIGYARVSTGKQDLALQLDALEEAGCSRVFADTASGSLDTRPELAKCLDYLRAGDTLVVWRLDRLGRSLRHLLETVAALEQRGVAFQSLRDPVDTSTPAGKLVFTLFAALAEFDRHVIRERTIAGMQAAAARGRHPGRKPGLSAEQLRQAQVMIAAGEPKAAVARTLGVGRSTLYRHLDALQRDGGDVDFDFDFDEVA